MSVARVLFRIVSLPFQFMRIIIGYLGGYSLFAHVRMLVYPAAAVFANGFTG